MSFITDTNGLSVQNSSYCHIINNMSYAIYIYCVMHKLHILHNTYKYCVMYNINMQQLKIEHKNVKKDRLEGKGLVIAISRLIYYLKDTDIYYVVSDSSDYNYYLVKFKPDVLESYCSCKDNSARGLKCKHLLGIEFAIKWGTIKDIEKVSNADITADQSTSNNIAGTNLVEIVTKRTKKSYLEDDYDF